MDSKQMKTFAETPTLIYLGDVDKDFPLETAKLSLRVITDNLASAGIKPDHFDVVVEEGLNHDVSTKMLHKCAELMRWVVS